MKPNEARVLLTGAAGGIGSAAAHALLRAGASVLLVGRNAEKLYDLAESLKKLHAPAAPVEWHTCDLTSSGGTSDLAAVATAWNCNVVVHNAGIGAFGHFDQTDPGAIRRVIETNLLAPMLLTHALLPHLMGLPEARVICVGSVLGRLGLPGYAAYGASKFGLRGFAEALRRELGNTPVKVQYLGPRSTKTPFNGADAEAFNRATGTASDPPELVAQALLDMLQSGEAERFLGFPEKLAVRINGLAPTLLDGSFAKHRENLPEPHHARPTAG